MEDRTLNTDTLKRNPMTTHKISLAITERQFTRAITAQTNKIAIGICVEIFKLIAQIGNHRFILQYNL